jgi:hypothetical protein
MAKKSASAARLEEARQRVLDAWDVWAPKNIAAGQAATGNIAFLFFNHLQQEQSPLLDSIPNDKWQTMHGWLLNSRKVTD